MSLFGKIIGGAVKTVLTPVAIVSDVVNVATGNEANSTKKHIDSIIDDFDDIVDGNIE